MRIFLLNILFLSLASTALALPLTVTGVSRVSNFEQEDPAGVPTIYGGIAGPDCGISDTSTCNSCTVPNFACNEKRIHAGLKLLINFTVTDNISGAITIGTEDSGYTPQTYEAAGTTAGTLNQGDTGQVEILWSKICADAVPDGSGNINCDIEGGKLNLVIGLGTNLVEPVAANRIDIPVTVAIPNSDNGTTPAADGYDLLDCADEGPSAGICDFIAFPGDEKITIKDLLPAGAWPQSNDVSIDFLRIFFSTVSFDAANYNTTQYIDIEVDTDGVPINDRVEGLANDIPHYFRPATVDKAGNVAFLVDLLEIRTDPDCDLTGAFNEAGCNLATTPSRVIGLLTEDLNCFVSTAAYGSSLSTEVQSFREFRNRYLLTSETGRWLNRLYYEYGPYLARTIHQNSFLKPVVRTALWPVAFLAERSNQRGIHIFFLGLFGISIMFGMSIFGGRQLWRKLTH